MDLSGYPLMDLDQDGLSGDTNSTSTEHDQVKWQGSQTANQALNQLIRTSVHDLVLAKAKENVDVNGSSSRNWQREPSFDQIPGFSLLSTKDSNSGSLPLSSTSSSIFQTSQPVSRPAVPRPRPSEAKGSRPTSTISGSANAPSQPLASSSSSLTIPFFDKTNPAQFLDLLKGVSERVDVNAGVRPRNSTGGTDTIPSSRIVKGKKRQRGISLGGTSEALAARLKKGRIEALRESGGVNAKAMDRDKGKGRVGSEAEDSGGILGDVGTSAQHTIAISAWGSSRAENSGGMEVDNGGDDWSMADKCGDSRDNGSSSSTSSQTKMPPPPLPVPVVKHPVAAALRVFPNSTSSGSTAPSSNLTSTSRPAPTSRSTHTYNQTTSKDIKPSTSSQQPKYHQLLLNPPAKVASSSSCPRQSNAQSKPPQVPATPAQLSSNQNLQPKIKSEPRPGYPPPPALHQTSTLQSLAAVPFPPSSPAFAPFPSSTPQIPSSQSSRPPALGMRRTHTLPSSSSAFASSSTSGKMVPSLQKSGVLPTKQRGFKPPLLSSSQPQTPSRSQMPNGSAHTSAVSGTTTITNIDTSSTQKKTNERVSKPHSTAVPKPPVSSNGSTSESSTSTSPQRGGSSGAIGPPSSSLSRSTSGSPAPSSSGASSFSVSTRAGPTKLDGSRATHSIQPSGSRWATNVNAKEAGKSDTTNGTHVDARISKVHVPPQPHPQPQPVQRPDSRASTKPIVPYPTPPPPPAPPPLVQAAAAVPPQSRPASPPLPGPADEDPDSSFGDMSFDMDALEETMRQYD